MNVRLLRALYGALFFCFLGAHLLAQTSAADLAFLRDKAESGNAIAQYNLGLIYADEDEPAFDIIEAYVWLSRAANNGARGRQLNFVAERLTPEELSEGNRRLGQVNTPAPRTAPVASPPAPISRAPLESSSGDLRELQAERDQLAAEVRQLRDQLSRSQSRGAGTIAELQKRVAIAETALANRNSETLALEARLAQLEAPGPSAEEVALRQERDRLAAGAAAAAQVAGLTATVGDLQSERDQLGEQLRTAEDQISELTTDLASTRADLAQLQRAHAESAEARDAELTSLQAQLTAAENAVTTVEAQLESARSQGDLSSQLAADLDAQSNQLETVITERDRLQLRLTEADDQIASLSGELINARANVARLRRTQAESGDASEAEMAALSSQLESAQESTRSLQSQLSAVQSERDLLADESGDLAQQLTEATDRIAELSEELATSQTDLSRLHQAQAESGDNSAAELAEYASRLEAADTRLDELSNQLGAMRRERDDYAEQAENLRNLAEEQRVQIERNESMVGELQSQLAAADSVDDSALTAVREELANVSSEREMLAGELSNLESQNAALLLEIDELRTASQTAVADDSSPTEAPDRAMQERLDASLRAFAVQEREMNRLREQLADATSRADASDATLVTVRDELAGLQTAMAELQDEAAANAEQAAFAESSTAAQEATLAELREELADARAANESRDIELAELSTQLASGSSTSTDLAAENTRLQEEARLAREQTAALSRELDTLRTRVAVSNTTLRAPAGRAAPSRPSAAPMRPTPAVSFPNPDAQPTDASPSAQPATAQTAVFASSEPVPTRTRSSAATGPRRHTILPGETLSRIARDFYGDGNRWPEILAANRDVIPDPNMLRVGTPIVIP